jgi:hypothetical protein
MIHRTRTQIPGQAEQLEHTEDSQPQCQTSHDPGVLEGPERGLQYLDLDLLVSNNSLRRPQLIQADIQG